MDGLGSIFGPLRQPRYHQKALSNNFLHKCHNYSLRVGWRFFFQLCCCVSFWFWWEIGFGFTYYLCTQRTIQLWCCVSFLVLVGNSVWCYVCIQCTIQLCSCVSFLVVAGNNSQNENTLLPKNLIGLLYYDPLADVCIS